MEETLGLQGFETYISSLVALVELEAFAGTYDPKCGPLKVYAYKSLFVQLPLWNDFKRMFSLYPLKLL